MKVNAIEIRSGHVLEHDGKLWAVMKHEIMQPGKGASVIQLEMRDVRGGQKTNVRFRTQEAVERVQLDDYSYQFLYADGDLFTFMQQETFEQIEVPGDAIGDVKVFLKDGMICQVRSYQGEVISVSLPQSETYEVAEADPVVKGQTASSSYKPAVLDNGAKVMVPPHVATGDRIVVRIEDATYMEKAKD